LIQKFGRDAWPGLPGTALSKECRGFTAGCFFSYFRHISNLTPAPLTQICSNIQGKKEKLKKRLFENEFQMSLKIKVFA